ncbi:MerR family transcriptional regulator [Saccharicrinis sp. FJH54]|uniref:MerR family transcriptional regulator n=1 Tax=Saccharicrinis sp. FJH54 TaxID=3344665 RepID=UPI0035D45476
MSKTYTIKDIEALTDIKAHTIRIWEQRYGIVHPDRTDGNSRRYSDEQLKKIMNIAFLNKRGTKISHIARMSNDEMAEKVRRFNKPDSNNIDIIDQIITAVLDQDDVVLQLLFDQSVDLLGMEEAINIIIRPVMKQIGVLWQTGTIDTTQEHFLSNFVRQKIITAIDGLPAPSKRHTFILFLPDEELHELGLLFYNYILRSMGFKVIYLGQSVPLEDLKMYHHIRDFDILLTTKTSYILEEELQKLVDDISQTFNKKILLISGLQFENKQIQFPPNAKFFRSADQLKKLINHLQ